MSTLLSYTKSAFVAFTKIVSADVNQFFTDIQNRVNWAGGTDPTTGMGDSNIQSNAAAGGGLTRGTKLKSGTAAYCVINDASGNMTEEQYLNVVRGGMGSNMNTGAISGDAPIFNGTAYAPAGPVPSGAVFPYVGITSPTGYLLCDGSLVSRTTYARLYGIIGVTYGNGDGSTTFNVPDLRGLFVRGASSWSTQSFTADSTSNTFTTAAGAVTRNGQPVQVSTAGTLPSGLSSNTTYYTFYKTSTTYQLYDTESDALVHSGTGLITITTNGSGTLNLTNFQDPDMASRTAATTGAAVGALPGSVQLDQFQNHTHPISVGVNAGSSTSVAESNATGTTTQATQGLDNGRFGPETRPKNLYFNHIIKT